VLRFRRRRRAVALVDVARRTAAAAALVPGRDRRVHIRLDARNGRGRRVRVLVDVVLAVLLLLAPLRLVRVTGRAVAAAGAFLLGPLLLPRRLALVDRLR